jgi:outer membrane protein assembly factor BamB
MISSSVVAVQYANMPQNQPTEKPAVNLGGWSGRVQAPQTPAVLWAFPAGSEVDTSAVISDLYGNGKLEVVVGSNHGDVFCLNGTTGNELWTYQTSESEPIFYPTVADLFGNGKKEVVVGADDGYTYCLNGTTGYKIWSYFAAAVDSRPAIADIFKNGQKEVITGSYSGNVYCLNGTTGNEIWSYATGGPIYSSPAVADLYGDGNLEAVVGSNDHNVYCLNLTTGTKLWSYNPDDSVSSSPGEEVYSSPAIADVLGNGRLQVIIGSDDHNLYCLNGTTGSKLWNYTMSNPVYSPVVADLFGDGNLEVVVGSNNSVYCLSGATGNGLWSCQTGGQVSNFPAVADVFGDGKQDVVVGSYDNNVYCIGGTNGSKLSSFQANDHVDFSPVVADLFENGKNEIVFGSWDCYVYCISMAPSSYVKSSDSSFIDIQSEYSSGNSTPGQGLWYAWVNTGNTQVVMLATSFFQGGGPSFNGHSLPSPISVIIGEHFNTSRGEVFVANTPTFMEIYNDSNHNGIPDSDFSHHSSEIIYYIIWNASQSFQTTPVEKQIDQENVVHYKWSVRYNGVAGILVPPFVDEEDKFPLTTCWIDYVACSYDYYVKETNSYLKVGFEVSPLTDLMTLKNVSGTYQAVPANLSLKGMSLAVLFATSIACAHSYQVMVKGQDYNSTTTGIPDIPTDNATINMDNWSVYNFIYNGTYTVNNDGTPETYMSKGSACGDVSVLSPYVLANGGPCLFLRWNESANVVDDLIARISNSLQVDTILRENSSFFYRVSFPVWGNGTLSYDPTYIGELNPANLGNPGGAGGEIIQIGIVLGVAFTGVAAILVVLLRRTRRNRFNDPATERIRREYTTTFLLVE